MTPVCSYFDNQRLTLQSGSRLPATQYGFSEVCQFIHSASEAGLQVSCFAFAPVKQQAELRALARELGAREFIVKTCQPVFTG